MTWSAISAQCLVEKVSFIQHLATLNDGDVLYIFAFDGKPKVEAEVALRWALLSKQLLFEADRQENGALQAIRGSASPEWRQLWIEAQKLRREYREAASEPFRQNDSAIAPLSETVHHLLIEIEQIEQRLRKTSPEYSAQSRLNRVEVRDVCDALRSGHALAEFVVFETPNMLVPPSSTAGNTIATGALDRLIRSAAAYRRR